MKFKLFSDNAKSFTFKHDFETTAILGYMAGTYEQSPVKTTISKNKDKNAYTLLIEYVEDNDLTKVFNRICDSFEGYSEA